MKITIKGIWAGLAVVLCLLDCYKENDTGVVEIRVGDELVSLTVEDHFLNIATEGRMVARIMFSGNAYSVASYGDEESVSIEEFYKWQNQPETFVRYVYRNGRRELLVYDKEGEIETVAK